MTKYVGKPIPRYDGIGHVTGATAYVDDINMPGMLYAKVLRSPVPKGVIRRIDVSGAENLPGVAAVITAKDIPGKNRYYNDEQPVFVEDHFRYKGERIAAVAAVDEDTAMEALEKIKIEIEEQPPVFDPFEAMKPTAPKVRPQGNLWVFNSGESRVVTKGDVEKGFAESDEIVERTYTEKMNDMAAIEPHVAVAYTDASDRLMIHTVSQARHFHLGHLCPIFNLPLSKICLIGGTVGGGFGGKNEVQTEHVAGLLALKLRKPVKYRLTRQEVLQCTTKRGAFYFEYKSGVKKNGKVMAYKIRAVHDIGAYNTMGAYAVEKHSFYIVGPYDVPHVRYDGYAVFTNKPVSSSMRGFSTINVNYAHEVQMDLMAEAIGMDPWEIRFINAWREGDIAPNQWKVVAAGLIETLKKTAEMEGMKLPPHLLAMSSQRREK